MSEIKFRFWDKTEKRMKFFDSIWNMPDPSHDFDEIQQFTGLKDKNGVEIYEGDILSLSSDIEFEDYSDGEHVGEYYKDFTTIESGNSVLEVAWLGTKFVADAYNKDGDILRVFGLEELSSDNTIIIANIYENPELMKSTKRELK